MATISTLVPYVENRTEEVVGAPVFWTFNEYSSAIMEAMCDLMLLVGRPDLIVSLPFNIVPNTPWQTVPKGMFCITNIQGPASEVWKIMLQDLDYAQVSDSGWEQDIGDSIQKWAPIGLTKFVVWPSVAESQTVLLTGIASPVVGMWPYDGTQPVPFNDEFFVALEKYAAGYLRIKESENEAAEGYKLYQEYLADAKRMTALEDYVDPYLFDSAVGAVAVTNPTRMR